VAEPHRVFEDRLKNVAFGTRLIALLDLSGDKLLGRAALEQLLQPAVALELRVDQHGHTRALHREDGVVNAHLVAWQAAYAPLPDLNWIT